MDRDTLFKIHRDLCSRGLALMEKKNRDYGGNTDPFKNFRTRGELGILIRLEDKLARLDSFIQTGQLHVKDESVEDTIIDGINYLVLLHAYIKEQKLVGAVESFCFGEPKPGGVYTIK